MPDTRRSGAETRERILAVAREHFARQGYDRTTIRAIAAEAQIDPSMVMRYFGNKEELFKVAASIDLALPDLTTAAPGEAGRVMAAHFVRTWDAEGTLMALLRRAASDPQAAEQMRGIFASQVAAAVAPLCHDPTEAPRRAALVATQLLGVALGRYVLRLPPIVEMTPDEIVTWVAPTIDRYLTADPAHLPQK
ncbi:AcrR family transcriptional regulator [Nocardioides luteus]|uniref:TetR family transcriptional regulator n=1 Tax=Nocardioides luteus TaxID=1844 RepID=A0ABQ5SWY7_9ACTN|nr:TetR family transcriptional regulator [Nocardioides luteus]MDR7312294.1 AcrR family transcriptional regulator [Nocardioides luteus]GGR57501.1 TetR family transcriptional regulator [Nocardioides luteus]GLJ68540.1 TetR family transcriptional regulator [Nocardioides luteus]